MALAALPFSFLPPFGGFYGLDIFGKDIETSHTLEHAKLM
jgi:hypothetical protein